MHSIKQTSRQVFVMFGISEVSIRSTGASTLYLVIRVESNGGIDQKLKRQTCDRLQIVAFVDVQYSKKKITDCHIRHYTFTARFDAIVNPSSWLVRPPKTYTTHSDRKTHNHPDSRDWSWQTEGSLRKWRISRCGSSVKFNGSTQKPTSRAGTVRSMESLWHTSVALHRVALYNSCSAAIILVIKQTNQINETTN